MDPRTKHAIVLCAAGLFLLALGFGAYALTTREPASEPAAPVSFPDAPLVPTVRTIDLPIRDGGTIAARDFLTSSSTIEDPSNEGTYYLAGRIDHCTEPSCERTDEDQGFTVLYYAAEGAFAVGLNREPLGEVRRAAEQYLVQALGVAPEELCALNAMVGTTVYVNAAYGSVPNLGFSMCPGATPLP